MADLLHPSSVLYAGSRTFPQLAACEHFAGSERTIRKALQIQAELAVDGHPVFDVTADCEDGAAAGREIEHADMIAAFLLSDENRFGRLGVRIHDVRHPAWRDELGILVARAGQRLAYVVLPKAESADDVREQVDGLNALCKQHSINRTIPVHVLIEAPYALREVWEIASHPQVETLDFGLMDFVSAHHGAIPASAMRSPGQFDHALIARAKCEIAAAALGNGCVPSHNVTTEIRDAHVVRNDARRARQEFGYLRMWSIHPNQIQPIIEAMRPDFGEVREASAILFAAQDAAWGPIQHEGKLHDRASYRYYWALLQRAYSTGMQLPNDVRQRFFS